MASDLKTWEQQFKLHRDTFIYFFPLVPENSENEADALLHFTAEFSSR